MPVSRSALTKGDIISHAVASPAANHTQTPITAIATAILSANAPHPGCGE